MVPIISYPIAGIDKTRAICKQEINIRSIGLKDHITFYFDFKPCDKLLSAEFLTALHFNRPYYNFQFQFQFLTPFFCGKLHCSLNKISHKYILLISYFPQGCESNVHSGLCGVRTSKTQNGLNQGTKGILAEVSGGPAGGRNNSQRMKQQRKAYHSLRYLSRFACCLSTVSRSHSHPPADLSAGSDLLSYFIIPFFSPSFIPVLFHFILPFGSHVFALPFFPPLLYL